MPKKHSKRSIDVDRSVSDTNRKVALSLVLKGYAISFANPSKECIVTGWQDNPVRTVAEVKEFFEAHPNAVPMIPTGGLNDVVVLDIDKKNGKDGFASLDAVGEYPMEHADFIVSTPNDGVHLYFAWAPGIGSSNRHLPNGVDLRGGHDDGRPAGYVIAPGAIIADGKYEAKGGGLPDTCIGLDPLPERFRPNQTPLRLVATDKDVNFAEVANALTWIPNDDHNPSAHSRDYWIAIGAALHHASGGSQEGLNVFIEWSSQHRTFDQDHTENAWDSFGRRDGVLATAGTVFFEARKFGWGKIELERLLDALVEDEQRDVAVDSDERIRLYTPSECSEFPHTEYLVKGLLAPGDLYCLFGEPGAGKSMLAPSIAYQIALGRSVFGLRTKQGKALYVAAEDEAGMRNRVGALKRMHGDTGEFLLAAGVSDLFTPASEDLKELCRIIKRELPALVVIDTLAMAFGTMEENSQESMVHVVNVCRLLARRGAAVVLVHHGTKADGGTPRGHSALNGALDGSMQLKPKDKQGVVRGVLKKNRRGSADLDIAFRIETIELGHDQDGDPIIGPYAKFLDAGQSERARLTPKQSAALKILNNLAVASNSVTQKEWRHACVDESSGVSDSEKADSRRRAATNAMKELEAKGYVLFDCEFVRTVSQNESELLEMLDDLEGDSNQELSIVEVAA